MFKGDWVVMDVNLVGNPLNPIGIIEVGAIRLNNKNMLIGKHESIVRLSEIDSWPEATWKDYGIEKVEVEVAPGLFEVFAGLSQFCQQADLTGWSGHNIMYAVQLGLNQSKHMEALYWAYKLDMRSYLSGKYGEVLSRDLKKVLEKYTISTIGLERPLVRCQRLLQLIEMKQESIPVKEEEYSLFEV